jgi:hypothetical protein
MFQISTKNKPAPKADSIELLMAYLTSILLIPFAQANPGAVKKKYPGQDIVVSCQGTFLNQKGESAELFSISPQKNAAFFGPRPVFGGNWLKGNSPRSVYNS